MANEQRDYGKIPSTACVMVVGEFEAKSRTEGAKSAPVSLAARSGQPVEHWFWGRIVHDLSGMHLHKSRLTIDYVHDPKEVIGYLNKFDISSGTLMASGALVPFKDSDRATEILHKMGEGVPYEASINFGGDGIVIEEVPDGAETKVNGYNFQGPGVVVREWPLRGVAICPYGADMNTESSAFVNNKQFAATVITVPEASTEESPMSESVEVAAAAEEPKPEVVEEVKAPVEAEPIKEVEAQKAVEAPVVESAPVEVAAAEELSRKEEVAAPVSEEAAKDSRDEFAQMLKDFGADVASTVFASGGGYAEAQKLAYEITKKENDDLKKQLAIVPGGQPAQFAAGGDSKLMTKDQAKEAYRKLSDPKEREQFRAEHAEELGLKQK